MTVDLRDPSRAAQRGKPFDLSLAHDLMRRCSVPLHFDPHWRLKGKCHESSAPIASWFGTISQVVNGCNRGTRARVLRQRPYIGPHTLKRYRWRCRTVDWFRSRGKCSGTPGAGIDRTLTDFMTWLLRRGAMSAPPLSSPCCRPSPAP